MTQWLTIENAGTVILLTVFVVMLVLAYRTDSTDACDIDDD